MAARVRSIPFEDLERAQMNWARIERITPAGLVEVLATLLRSSPDPDSALNYFERFVLAASTRTIQYLTRYPGALNILVPIFSQSHFLSETLLLQPDYVEWLHRDKRVEFIKSKEDLLEELSRFETTLTGMSLAERLARFKRREYLRIAFRDVTRIASLAETTEELSTLADVVLEKALRGSDQPLRNRFGAPQYVEETGRVAPAQFVVLALGKLGGNELNYSSDIDLLYLYSQDGETKGIEGQAATIISNQEYFIKLASAINDAVGGVTPSGWAFRVDLRLRPQGREGFLARSLQSTVHYYQDSAQPWELQALLKARPVAGDLGIGKRLLQSLRPVIYPSEDRGRIVESIEQMRLKLDEKLESTEGSGFNVKLARGTIRDVEFITQCLQRLYGATDFWVREGNTVRALRRLHDNSYIEREDFVSLASAYEFFRIVEHRLQLDRGQQTHRLSDNEGEQQRLALRMGFEDTPDISAREALLHAIEYHCGIVTRVYRRLLQDNVKSIRSSAKNLPGVEVAEERREINPAATEDRIFSEFAKTHPRLSAVVVSLLIEKQAKPKFMEFLEAMMAQPDLLGSFECAPGIGEALQAIFNSGVVVPELFLRHMEWGLEMIQRGHPLSDRQKSKLRSGQRSIPRSARGMKSWTQGHPDRFKGIADLRSQIRRNVFDILVEDVWKSKPVDYALRRLSVVAERALKGAFELAKGELLQKLTVPSQALLKDKHFYFTVFALGRLATNELDVGSDLDLSFFCDYSYFKNRDAVRAVATRLAETMVSIVTSYTREGPLYNTDLRLRPSGKEGELVQDAGYLLDYLGRAAETWEHVAYLKMRPVAGNLAWGKEMLKKIRSVSFGALRFSTLKEDILDMRARLEQSSEASEGCLDLKSGSGGIYDIDFAVAYCHLTHKSPYRSGFSLPQAIRQCSRQGWISKSSLDCFCGATNVYRALDHSIRLLKGKPVRIIHPDLLGELNKEQLRRLHSLVSRTSEGIGSSSHPTADTLMEALRRIAAKVRNAMEEILMASR